MIVAGVSLGGCGTSTTDRALSGAAIGAGVGAVGGALFGIPAIGAALGAVTGVSVGVVTKPTEATVGVGMPVAPAGPTAERRPTPDHVITTYASQTLGPRLRACLESPIGCPHVRRWFRTDRRANRR